MADSTFALHGPSLRRPALRLMVALTMALAGLGVNGLGVLAECGHDSIHWYARADSGCCAQGTKLNTTLPTSWSVQCCISTTDEAAWVINKSTYATGVEAGYFSGYWPYGGGFFSGLLPYYTLNNGNCPCTRGSTYLTAGKNINMYAVNGGWAQVDAQKWTFSYNVSNLTNSGQGEVTQTSATWMGGGSGESFSAYWSNNGTNWNQWGFHNDCNNSPYWITSQSSFQYTNGGY